jgi:hypothetical protein
MNSRKETSSWFFSKTAPSVDKELIHVSSLNYIHVCLINTGLGTPFILAIKLRPLINASYVTKSG